MQLSYSMFMDVLFPKRPANEEEFALRQVVRHRIPGDALLRRLTICVFDFETTGLDHQLERIIEVGAIKIVNGEIVSEFSSLVNPEMLLLDRITTITGITNEMLVGQPTITQVLPQFLDFINGSLLLAHNADFDMAFLNRACSRQGIDLDWPALCTLKLSRALLPDLERHKLDNLAEHYGQTFEARHRSIGDVKVTAGVFLKMLQEEGRDLQKWSQFLPYVSG
jgi:DNA polymerase III subunit epsilon